MDVIFDNVKIIETIGSGMYGTLYLVKYENEKYALKIQKILPNDKIKNHESKVWREIDLYNYINKLELKNQCFLLKCMDMNLMMIANINKSD